MASANYWQRGETLDYLNTGSTKIEAGEVVVIGSRIGVAGTDIPAGALGSVYVEGVYAFPKGSDAITLGANVTYDAENEVMAAAEDGDDINGFAVEAAGASDSTVKVKINA